MDSSNYVDWFSRAKENLATAEHSFNNQHPKPLYSCFYLCQMAIENYLKGLLVKNNTEPDKTHDLILLLEKCERIDPLFTNYRREISFINGFKTTAKYPNQSEILVSDCELAINIGKQIEKTVIRY